MPAAPVGTTVVPDKVVKDESTTTMSLSWLGGPEPHSSCLVPDKDPHERQPGVSSSSSSLSQSPPLPSTTSCTTSTTTTTTTIQQQQRLPSWWCVLDPQNDNDDDDGGGAVALQALLDQARLKMNLLIEQDDVKQEQDEQDPNRLDPLVVRREEEETEEEEKQPAEATTTTTTTTESTSVSVVDALLSLFVDTLEQRVQHVVARVLPAREQFLHDWHQCRQEQAEIADAVAGVASSTTITSTLASPTSITSTTSKRTIPPAQRSPPRRSRALRQKYHALAQQLIQLLDCCQRNALAFTTLLQQYDDLVWRQYQYARNMNSTTIMTKKDWTRSWHVLQPLLSTTMCPLTAVCTSLEPALKETNQIVTSLFAWYPRDTTVRMSTFPHHYVKNAMTMTMASSLSSSSTTEPNNRDSHEEEEEEEEEEGEEFGSIHHQKKGNVVTKDPILSDVQVAWQHWRDACHKLEAQVKQSHLFLRTMLPGSTNTTTCCCYYSPAELQRRQALSTQLVVASTFLYMANHALLAATITPYIRRLLVEQSGTNQRHHHLTYWQLLLGGGHDQHLGSETVVTMVSTMGVAILAMALTPWASQFAHRPYTQWWTTTQTTTVRAEANDERKDESVRTTLQFSYKAALLFCSFRSMLGNALYAAGLPLGSLEAVLVGRLFLGLGLTRFVNRWYVADGAGAAYLTEPSTVASRSAACVTMGAMGMLAGDALAFLCSMIPAASLEKSPWVGLENVAGWIMMSLWMAYMAIILIYFDDPPHCQNQVYLAEDGSWSKVVPTVQNDTSDLVVKNTKTMADDTTEERPIWQNVAVVSSFLLSTMPTLVVECLTLDATSINWQGAIVGTCTDIMGLFMLPAKFDLSGHTSDDQSLHVSADHQEAKMGQLEVSEAYDSVPATPVRQDTPQARDPDSAKSVSTFDDEDVPEDEDDAIVARKISFLSPTKQDSEAGNGSSPRSEGAQKSTSVAEQPIFSDKHANDNVPVPKSSSVTSKDALTSASNPAMKGISATRNFWEQRSKSTATADSLAFKKVITRLVAHECLHHGINLDSLTLPIIVLIFFHVTGCVG